MCFLLSFRFVGYIMLLISLQCSPPTVSWVPQEWPGLMWKLRARISGNKGHPTIEQETLALYPK